jgi:hypothetical protein
VEGTSPVLQTGKRLKATRLASEGSISGKIQYERGKGLSFEAKLPPEEQIAEFLMALRFFYLQDEPTHFPKVLRLIGRQTKNSSDLKEALKSFRRQWEDSLFGKAFEIKLNDKRITTSLLLDLWFNAYYFHSDEMKGQALRELRDFFSDDYAKYMLLEATFESAKVVFKLFDGVHEMVRKHFAD